MNKLNGLIEHPNGDKEWWLNGKLHKEDGPSSRVA